MKCLRLIFWPITTVGLPVWISSTSVQASNPTAGKAEIRPWQHRIKRTDGWRLASSCVALA
jgi:hypothetical protein